MIAFNRIGNKLGLVGAAGILLAMGMVANQIVTESAISAANQRAETLQSIADHTIASEVYLRRKQIALRDVRLARTSAGVERAADALRKFAAEEEHEIDAALLLVVRQEDRNRLQKVKSLIHDYTSGAQDLIKAHGIVLRSTDELTAISAEWSKAVEAQRAMPSLAESSNRREVEDLLLQSDAQINRMGAALWRFGATGEESQKKVLADSQSALVRQAARAREIVDDKAFQRGIDGLTSVVNKFVAANNEIVKAEEIKLDVVKNRTLTFANQADELLQAAASSARSLVADTKASAASELAQANRIGLILATVVMISLIGSVVFSFLGIARPLTRLNGALGRMAGGELSIEIPGARRGDEVGDIAKTVVVIRGNAEQKARDEAEAKTRQDQIAAQQRKADMIKLADQFEGAVGEIVETVSSASTELEASASTLTSAAGRAQELTTMVATASEEASANVQSVASATEELSSSVNEISRQVQESARIATEPLARRARPTTASAICRKPPRASATSSS